MRKWPRFQDYVPGTAAGRTFAVTSLISSVGTGLFLTGSAVFFVRSVGLSTAQVGLGLAVSGVVGFLASVPIGVLGDRIGALPVLIGLQVWRAGWFVALAFAHGMVGFVVFSSLLAAAEGATQPISQAVATSVTEAADRTRTMAAIRSVRNAGFSLGALLAAPLLATNDVWAYRAIILGNSLAFVASAVMLKRLRVLKSAQIQRKVAPLAALKGFRDWHYLLLAGLNGVLNLHTTILSVGLPLWLLAATPVSPGLLPVIIVINTVMSVTLQVPVARGAEGPGGPARALRLGGVALAGCCLVMALAKGPSALIAAALLVASCVLVTFAEMWQAVGSWDLSDQYAPAESKNIYLSVFSLGATGQRIVGPAVVSGVVIASGRIGWMVLAGVLCLSAVLVTPVLRMLQHSRDTAAAPLVEAPAPSLSIR